MHRYDDIYFCNPALHKFIKLPACPLGIPRGCRKIPEHSGFEYDPFTNDYEVIRLVTMTPNKICGYLAFVVRADVYNLSTSSWRELDTVPR